MLIALRLVLTIYQMPCENTCSSRGALRRRFACFASRSEMYSDTVPGL